MTYNVDFTIIVSQTDLNVIRELHDALNRCPYSLTNDDFAQIIEAISNKWDSPNNENIRIVYEEDEE